MLDKNNILMKDKLIATAKEIESEIGYSDFDNDIKIKQIYANGQYYIYDDETIDTRLDELEIELNKDPRGISYHLYKSIYDIVNNDYRYDLLDLLSYLTLFQFNYDPDDVYDDDFYGHADDEGIKLNIDNERFSQCMDENDLETENKTLKIILDFEVSIDYATKQTNYFTITNDCELDSLNKINDKNIMILANNIIETLDLDFDVKKKNNNAFNIEENYDINILMNELSSGVYKRLERECKNIFLANSTDVVFMFDRYGVEIKYFSNCINDYTQVAFINDLIKQNKHNINIKIENINVLANYPDSIGSIHTNKHNADKLINYKDIIIENFKEIIDWGEQTKYGDCNLYFKLNKGTIEHISKIDSNRLAFYNKNNEIIMVMHENEIHECYAYKKYDKIDELISKINSLIKAYGK